MTYLKPISGFLLGILYQAQVWDPFWHSYQLHEHYSMGERPPIYPIDWPSVYIRLAFCLAAAVYFAGTERKASSWFSIRRLCIFVILVVALLMPVYKLCNMPPKR